MKKWILVFGVALVSVAAAVTWKTQFATDTSEDNALLSYVPADTIYYLGGESSKELAAFFGQMPNGTGSTPTQIAQMDALFAAWDTSGSPSAKFFKFLIDKTRQQQGTFKQRVNNFGLSFSGPYAIYSHGIAPVLRVQIQSKTVLESVINEAVAASGWIPQTQTIENNTIRLWELSSASDAIQLYFVISATPNILTATLVSSIDDDTTKWERLGLTKPANPITNTNEVTLLQERYGFTEAMTGFIHFERLANAFLQPETNAFGQQLQMYLPENTKAEMNQNLTQACRKDFATLAAAMPRFVVGYENIAINKQTFAATLNTVWEINNTQVTQALSNVRGHIPQHALHASDKIAHFGAGLSFDKLTPALTSLWNLFVNADFSCEQLVQAQEKARQSNPAILAMFLGMTQGIEGFGISLYDIDWAETQGAMPVPSQVSALFSISAQNPQTVAGLTAMLPMLGGIQVPTDGSSVNVPVPLLPPSISVKAAIKGKHLVVYTDDSLAPQLDALTREDLSPNGLYSFGVNYRRFEALTKLKVGNIAGMQACISQHEFAHMFTTMPMDFSYLGDISEHGVSGTIDFTLEQYDAPKLSLPGEYQVALLNEACEWEIAGQDSLNADGSGTYLGQDAQSGCTLYASDYTWVEENQQLISSTTMEAYRDTCDQALPEKNSSSDTFTCYLLNIQQDSFQCMYDPGTPDVSLYRYTRK